MTTLFGLNYPEVNMSILVGDRQTTWVNKTGIPSQKALQRKMRICKSGDYCFGQSGNKDSKTEEFMQDLYNGKFDIRKITKEGYFPKLREMNISRMGKKIPSLNDLTGLIIATRFDNKPSLFTCFPLGEVGERIWTCSGSGDEKINEYMKSLEVIDQARDYLPEVKLNEAEIIRRGLEAVRRSQSQDVYSQGLDLLVCLPEKIVDHFEDLGDGFAKVLRLIQDRYSNKSTN